MRNLNIALKNAIANSGISFHKISYEVARSQGLSPLTTVIKISNFVNQKRQLIAGNKHGGRRSGTLEAILEALPPSAEAEFIISATREETRQELKKLLGGSASVTEADN